MLLPDLITRAVLPERLMTVLAEHHSTIDCRPISTQIYLMSSRRLELFTGLRCVCIGLNGYRALFLVDLRELFDFFNVQLHGVKCVHSFVLEPLGALPVLNIAFLCLYVRASQEIGTG